MLAEVPPRVRVEVAVSPAKVAVPEKAGDAEKTTRFVPVSSVSAVLKFAEVKEPKTVALPVEVIAPVKLALVVTLPAVKPAAVPVMFVPTNADGVPSAGVMSVGEVAKTRAPEPVSSVTAAMRLADDGVPKNVATFAARPETPVEIGSPVALVRVMLVGVPRIGVTKVGEVAKTATPLPVSSVSAAESAAESAVVVALLWASVNNARDAV
jgi:hypothetical protein